MSVAESASRLFDLLASQDTAFTRHLQPELPDERIQEIIAPVTVSLPAKVLDFHRHFNLPKGYAYGPDQPTFYGIYWLLGLEDAVAFWLERRSYDFLEEREHDWFPVLQEDGNAYLVDTVADPQGSHRIVKVFHACPLEVEFISLTAMFDAFYRWLHDGVLKIEDGHVAGDYDGDPQRVAQIAARLNPGVETWRSRLGSKSS